VSKKGTCRARFLKMVGGHRKSVHQGLSLASAQDIATRTHGASAAQLEVLPLLAVSDHVDGVSFFTAFFRKRRHKIMVFQWCSCPTRRLFKSGRTR